MLKGGILLRVLINTTLNELLKLRSQLNITDFLKKTLYAVVELASILSFTTSFANVLKQGARVDQVFFH